MTANNNMADNNEEKQEHINLKVVGQDGNEVSFKIKRRTPFQKLFNAYTTKTGLDAASVKFMFDGQRLQPESNPDEAEMEDNDIINVQVTQVGGCRGACHV